MRVVALVSGERRRESVVHIAEGGTVGEPHAVADMVHPALPDLGIGRMDSVLLHHKEVEILHIRVVVGEGSVHCCHLPDCLVEHERRFTRLLNEFVFILESVDVSDHLPEPRPGNLVAELNIAYLGCLRLACAGKCQKRCCGRVKYSFHYQYPVF